MSDPKSGRPPLDHGATVYTVTLQFSNDYPSQGEEGHPEGWDWASLLDEPDARCIAVAEIPNPDWDGGER